MAIFYTDSASFGDVSITGSLVMSEGQLQGTASYVTGSIYRAGNLAQSASYAITAAYALTGGTGGSGGTTFVGGTNVDNRLITATGNTPSELNGEANLTFNGSTLTLTGSYIVAPNQANELQVYDAGIIVGNALTDVHRVTGSLQVNGGLTGSLLGTASFASRPSMSFDTFTSTATVNATIANLGTISATGPTQVYVVVNGKLGGNGSPACALYLTATGKTNASAQIITASIANTGQRYPCTLQLIDTITTNTDVYLQVQPGTFENVRVIVTKVSL